MPMIAASIALSFAESVFPGEHRASLSSFMRKAAVCVTVATATLSSFFFGVQSLLSGAADTAGMKTVKFAVGSFVPYVGGAVGDTVSAIATGAGAVKDVFGVILLAAIFVLMLTPVVTLLAGKCVLGGASLLSGVLGQDKDSKLFSDLSGTLSCMIAVVVSAGAAFLVIVSAFISYGATL